MNKAYYMSCSPMDDMMVMEAVFFLSRMSHSFTLFPLIYYLLRSGEYLPSTCRHLHTTTTTF